MVINVSISQEFDAVGKYLSTIKNKSRYICELIERDMNHKEVNVRITEEDIIRIAKAVVEMSSPQTQPRPRQKNNEIKLDLRNNAAQKTASSLLMSSK